MTDPHQPQNRHNRTCEKVVKRGPEALLGSDNRSLVRIAALAFLAASLAAAESHLDSGIELQRSGKLKEADRELRAAITELSAAGDSSNRLRALSVESWISVSLGNYSDAILQATEAVQLRRA